MRKVSISQINDGQILAKSVYDHSGRMLLVAGTTLKPGYKMRLNNIGVFSVFIDDEFSKDIEIDDMLSQKTREETKSILKNGLRKFISNKHCSSNEILKIADTIIEDILSREKVIINISDIKSKDEHLYEHCISVCALAIIMGIYLKYPQDKLKEMAIGALLHDIGKLLTPKDILVKLQNNTLSDEEFEIFKSHPIDGYEILNTNEDISYISKAIILMHHEYCDGTGFPLGLTEDKLHETVKIVSICDTFDNLISDFSGCKKMEVYKALEYLIAMSETIFDKTLVNAFIKNIAAYPCGTIVKLNTNDYAIVLKQNTSFPLRPIVNIILDQNKNKLDLPKQLDLSKENTVFIVDTVDTI
ncbi:HD-GYP domain-containing protein [Clostridium botulinum]|uniref:Diguanylate cyclase n=1 Tax=Clostridium botulinum C/D str. DC5 TaxID=1443128 RepID=A0A0A0I5A4_CLOBO|nr:HD-GYP domain-containing protein [Clostridium botulinum]KEI00705.1 diguanylate cyclase [Clostridium botulinum C/D str. BKT75002]KEI08451.1 diguanylate cyclase [Clostridium botulinum C/D str. BKT2873]KGM96027.1 diguanylate cyclase [Clostridium botulinum C/D str. DC5]KGM96710.1 diguanylate cyclase [Clostridium botulinum D str. CCUG 7971]KOC51284.1 diguanylate cyclase [Clostridium botulinum]